VAQQVTAAVPVRPWQATLAQLDQALTLEVQRPPEALPDRGGLQLTLSPRLGAGGSGVRQYMQSYPYTCLEQRVSRAVALQDQALWEGILRELPTYLDKDGLARYFPPSASSTMSQGSEVLTAYLLSIAAEAGWAFPDPLRDKMEGALRAFVSGKLVRYSALPRADLGLRKLGALEALSRRGEVAQAELESLVLEPNLWPTSALLDWINILQRSPSLPQAATRLQEAERILRARLYLTGSGLTFSTEQTDRLWWLMTSWDQNAVRALLTLLPLPGWQEDLPRLLQGAVARQQRGVWDTTLANAWGTLALLKFSRQFQADPVSGATEARLGGTRQSLDWAGTPDGRELAFPWPAVPESLKLQHSGTGKPWVNLQSLAAVPLQQPFFAGYQVRKTLIPIEHKQSGRWSRGDVVRVRLDMEALSDMTWVVVDDPIPAGGRVLSGGLGRDSKLLTAGEKQEGWVWPAFQEHTLEAFRAYYEYVPKGRWTVEYTLRLNNEGRFGLPPTRVSALYAPEMFAEIPNASLQVHPLPE
jgi:hypothetical protein